MDDLVRALLNKRAALDVSHDDMARALGISRTTWFDTVMGRRPVGRAVRLGIRDAGGDFADLVPLLERDEAGAA